MCGEGKDQRSRDHLQPGALLARFSESAHQIFPLHLSRGAGKQKNKARVSHFKLVYVSLLLCHLPFKNDSIVA